MNFRLSIQSTSLNIDQKIPFFGLSLAQIKLLLLVLRPESGSELRGTYRYWDPVYIFMSAKKIVNSKEL